MINKSLKNFTGFIDGFGWAGVIQELTPPTIALATEEYSAGGMAGTVDIDMGQIEKLETEMVFAEHNPQLYKHFGNPDLQFTARGVQDDGNGPQAVIFQMRGLMRQIEPGGMKPKSKTELKTSFTPTVLTVTVGSEEVMHIDVENMIRRIGGVDQLAGQRSALGL